MHMTIVVLLVIIVLILLGLFAPIIYVGAATLFALAPKLLMAVALVALGFIGVIIYHAMSGTL